MHRFIHPFTYGYTMKKTKYIRLALVSAALSSCNIRTVPADSCPVPVYQTNGTRIYSPDSCACQDALQARYDLMESMMARVYFPYPQGFGYHFFGPSFYSLPGFLRSYTITRAGFGSSMTKGSS